MSRMNEVQTEMSLQVRHTHTHTHSQNNRSMIELITLNDWEKMN